MSDLDLSTVHLSRGAHDELSDDVCVVELARVLGGYRKDDLKAPISGVLATWFSTINDELDDERRQFLAEFAPALLHTEGREYERLRIMVQHAMQIFAPAALRAVSLGDLADDLARGVPYETLKNRAYCLPPDNWRYSWAARTLLWAIDAAKELHNTQEPERPLGTLSRADQYFYIARWSARAAATSVYVTRDATLPLLRETARAVIEA